MGTREASKILGKHWLSGHHHKCYCQGATYPTLKCLIQSCNLLTYQFCFGVLRDITWPSNLDTRRYC